MRVSPWCASYPGAPSAGCSGPGISPTFGRQRLPSRLLLAAHHSDIRVDQFPGRPGDGSEIFQLLTVGAATTANGPAKQGRQDQSLVSEARPAITPCQR